MQILLTGVTGFVGSHLASELVDDGHDVHGFARYVADRGGMSPGPVQGVEYHLGDILDPYSVRETVEEVEPDVILHLATQSSVEYSFNNPYHSYNVGFLGTVHVAQATMNAIELDHFVFASSVEVYGNRETFPLHEEMHPEPASPYGVAKVASEEYLRYLYRKQGFPITIFRSTNTYGRKRSSRFVVERTIDQMLHDQDIVRLGDPDPIRDFLYVDDEVRAFKRVMEAGPTVHGETFNTGTARGISIRELIDEIADLVGYKGEVKWYSNSHRPLEIDKLVADYSKLEEFVGWEPKYTLRQGLKKTVREWSE